MMVKNYDPIYKDTKDGQELRPNLQRYQGWSRKMQVLTQISRMVKKNAGINPDIKDGQEKCTN